MVNNNMLDISNKVNYLSNAMFIEDDIVRGEYLANSYKLMIICNLVNEYFENKIYAVSDPSFSKSTN